MCFEGITTARGLSTSGIGVRLERDEASDIADEGSIVVVQKEDERHRGYVVFLI